MNRHLIAAFALLVLLPLLSPNAVVNGQDSEAKVDLAPILTTCRSTDPIEMEVMIDDLESCDVIFLGEQHDNDSGHRFQLEVIQRLVDAGRDVVVSTEQFERDTQGAVDDYLSGRITEDEFLAHSRPWNNYAAHYRPIVEYAKERRLPILAANLPRPVASGLSTGKSIAWGDQVFLPRETSTPEDAYWSKFRATMQGHMGADGENQLKAFYASQCAKDDAMAESITDYLAQNRHRRKTVVHLCGHFHSDQGLGTAGRVLSRNPLLRIGVVTMERIPENGKLDLQLVRDRGHYVLWTVANPPKESKPVDEQEAD